MQPRGVRGWWQNLLPDPPAMRERSPTELLDDLRLSMPATTDEALLREHWLRRLPTWLLIALLHTLESLDDLAVRAELAVRSRHASLLPPREAQLEARVENLASMVRDLTLTIAEQRRSPPSNRASPPKLRSRVVSTDAEDEGSRQPSPIRAKPPPVDALLTKGWCWYHLRWGRASKTCRTPCTFPRPMDHSIKLV
eukprot:XP_016656062.1 PREDICTED: uncharacterized protein LOC107882344 [Acyrthosiphon pisum]